MAGISGERRDLDVIAAGLVRWFADQRPDATTIDLSPFRTNPSSGFSSESLLFDVAYTEGGRCRVDEHVLRLPPAGGGMFPTYDLARQAATQNLLASDRTEAGAGAGAALPTAAPAVHEPDESWIGTDFLLMPRIDGRIPSDFYPVKGWLRDAHEDLQRSCYQSYIDALVMLHRFDVDAGDVAFLARPAGLGLAAEVGWWAEYLAWATDGQPDGQMADAYRWAGDTAPADRARTITWGDARFANAVFDDRGRVVGMLDWEQAAVGPPELDIGWWLATRRRCRDVIGISSDRDLPGFLSAAATVDRFEAGLGRELRAIEWHEAFAAIRMGTCIVAIQSLLRRLGRDDHFMLQARASAGVDRRLHQPHLSSGSECRDDRLEGGVGQSAQLVVGAVLDGMGHEDCGRVEAEGASLGGGRLDELGRGDEHTR